MAKNGPCSKGSANYRFGKSLKIKKNLEIREVLRSGRRFAGRYFSICYKKNDLSWSRYALITPKIIGSAVARNRARRVMRELLRREPCRELHLDVLFRLNSLTGMAGTDALKGALSQWYDSLKK
jgi:ribonuclease P protein component